MIIMVSHLTLDGIFFLPLSHQDAAEGSRFADNIRLAFFRPNIFGHCDFSSVCGCSSYA